MDQSLDLNTHLIESEPHQVNSFPEQKYFYSQSWSLPISKLNDNYKSSYFSHQSFKIFFTLVYDENCYKICGSINSCNVFNAFNVYFRIDLPDGQSMSTKGHWVFKANQRINWCKFETLTKSILFKEPTEPNNNNEIINDNSKSLNAIIYFEICQSVNKLTNNQQIKQQENMPKQEPGRIGLDNIKSICYMNSSLQILFHIPQFRQILYDYDTSRKSSLNKILYNTQFLFYMMQQLDRPYTAIELYDVSKQFLNDPSRQKDATEFIYILFEKLKEEMKGTEQVTKLEKMFQIEIESKKECKPVNFFNCFKECSDFIVVPVLNNGDEKQQQQQEQADKNPIKLYSCIKEYLKRSPIEYRKDGIKYEGYEWREIKCLPPVLSIYLNRVRTSSLTQHHVEKYTTPVIFKESMYFDDFSHIIDDKYRLYAILCHYGIPESGHYYALIREFPTKEWYLYNDKTVKKIKEKSPIDNKVSEEAYALFYIRKKEQNNLFENNKLCPIMKEFMEKCKFQKEQEKLKENLYTLHFTLEEDMNKINLIKDKSIISSKTLDIDKEESHLSLYQKVAQLFEKDFNEIRLWKTDSYNISKTLIDTSDDYNITPLKNSLIFIQNKKIDENVIPEMKNNEFVNTTFIMIFVKFFDLRLKNPIRYIGPIIVDANKELELPPIYKILGFPEWTKFRFFSETDSMTFKRLTPSMTFKSAGLSQGSNLIVQIDKQSTLIEKRIQSSGWTNEEIKAALPDLLSKSKTFEGVELRHKASLKNIEVLQNKPIESSDQISPEKVVYQTSSGELIPHYNAIDYVPDFDKSLFDNFIACNFNMNHFRIYDYDCLTKPAFILDFPSSMSKSDMCNVIRKIMEYTNEGLILLFNKYQRGDMPARQPITDQRFDTLIEKKMFPANRIYFLYDKKLTSFMNKKVFDLQIASDGYNVSFTKTVVAPKMATTFDLLKSASENENFPINEFKDYLDRVEKKIASLKEIKLINTKSDTIIDNDSDENKIDFKCFQIVDNRIDKVLDIKDTIVSNNNPIRVVPFIPPKVDEVPVFVFHVEIVSHLCVNYIKDPFYMNVKKTISVKEFKEKVLNKVKIDDVDEFMKTKLDVMETSHKSTGNFKFKDDDLLVDLKPNSTIFIVH